jgi:hypothetical protein
MKNKKEQTPDEEINQCNFDAEKVEKRITFFGIISWGLVGSGLLLSIFLIINFNNNNVEKNYSILAETIAGIVGTCWTLASVFFVYVAFLGQKKQLIFQKIEIIYNRMELKFNTLELKGQREELIEQNKTITIQRFENSFYNLLTILNSIIIDMNLPSVELRGRIVFKKIYKKIEVEVDQNGNNSIENLMAIYTIIYDEYKDILSHYFRTLYHLFKLINEFEFEQNNNELNFKIQKRYTSIIRAQLSSHEQILLFYNCLHLNGEKKFKPLIEKYSLFNNIDFGLLFGKDHKNYYNKSAFE